MRELYVLVQPWAVYVKSPSNFEAQRKASDTREDDDWRRAWIRVAVDCTGDDVVAAIQAAREIGLELQRRWLSDSEALTMEKYYLSERIKDLRELKKDLGHYNDTRNKGEGLPLGPIDQDIAQAESELASLPKAVGRPSLV